MKTHTNQYSTTVVSSLSFDDTLTIVRQALTEQGFGVLSEIDVSATLKKKLEADYPKTIILGACNPALALRALTAVPDISVFLPCNVVVRVHNGGIEVAIINTLMISEIVSNTDFTTVAQEVDKRLSAVLDAVVSQKE